MSYIDHHCHLSDERIFSSAQDLIDRAKQGGVRYFGLGGVEPKDWKRQLELKKDNPKELLLTFGLHPMCIEHMSATEIEDALTVLDRELVHANALGETGLDFYPKGRNPERFDDQREVFRLQIRMAKRHQKPLVLHVVFAHEECIQILKEEAIGDHPFVLHSYSGNATQLKEYLKLNAYVSYSATLLRGLRNEGFEKVAKAFVQTPIDRILFETDAPDQGSPEPLKIIEIYQEAARVLSVSEVHLQEQVLKNFHRLYSIES